MSGMWFCLLTNEDKNMFRKLRREAAVILLVSITILWLLLLLVTPVWLLGKMGGCW